MEILNNRDFLWNKFVVEGVNVTEIAKEFKIRASLVNEALKTFNISKNDRKILKYPLLYNKTWMTQKYSEQKLGAKEIAELLSVQPSMVYEALEFLDIPKRKGYSPGLKYAELDNKEWLYDQFIVQNKTVRQIAKDINANYGSVIYMIMHFGFKKESYKNTVRQSKYPQLNDREWLYQKRVVENMSLCAIADLVHTTHMNVKFALIKHGIIEKK